MMQANPHIRQRGFTLLEALIALVVMAFGMLAIAGLQTTLSRNSDVAKQRSEAVRLAQAKLEQLRAFDGILAASGVAFSYATGVVSSAASTPETISAGTNTTFTRTWTVRRANGLTESTPDDLEKWVNVTVSWTDRTGEPQRVTLNSVIARNDPLALKGLVAGQARERIRYPKGRNINIPYPAVTLSDGKSSAFMPPPGNVVYVFDNDTGNILKSCVAPAPVTLTSLTRSGSTVTALAPGHGFSSGNKVKITGTSAPAFNGTFVLTSAAAGDSFTYVMSAPLPTDTASTGGSAALEINLVEGMDLSTSGLSCTDFAVNAYLLSGYVRFKAGGSLAPRDVENTTDPTLDLLASGPLVIDTTATGSAGAPVAQVCYAQRQKVLSASRLDPEDISSIVRSGGSVTLTTRRSHSFVPGLRIAVEFVPVTPGPPPINFNNSFTVLTATATTLTYADDGPDASASTGRVSLIQQITLPESTPDPAGYGGGGPDSRFIAYSCVVTPPNDDGDASTPPAWWGDVRLVPSGWSIGSTAATYRVCRYSGDYIVDSKVSNHEHPRYYRRVTGALDNQNFLVIAGNQNCPTDVDPAPLSGDFINTNTVVHQGGPGPAYSFKCKTAACSSADKVVIEPEDATTVIEMF